MDHYDFPEIEGPVSEGQGMLEGSFQFGDFKKRFACEFNLMSDRRMRQLFQNAGRRLALDYKIFEAKRIEEKLDKKDSV